MVPKAFLDKHNVVAVDWADWDTRYRTLEVGAGCFAGKKWLLAGG